MTPSIYFRGDTMTYEEMKTYIEHIDNSGLIDLCNEIYDWKYISGELEQDSALKNLAKDIQCKNVKDVEEVVVEVAAKKLNKVVLLLMQNKPHEFLKV